MGHKGTERALFEHNLANAKASAKADKKRELKPGDRVMDTLINQPATIVKAVRSALVTEWVVAYLITYDDPPPVEYNMGEVNSMQFSKWIRPVK